MDNPGISLFQGADIQINNSKNVEEEEDLEDQLRRKEELQNLLQAKLDDFKYEDSTINSSTNVSQVSTDNAEQLYKEAITPNEQLKVLYDVRCREIQALKDEYDKYKFEKSKELEGQKHKNVLLEAELRQLGISLKNSENLLVDKTDTINALTKTIADKDVQINNLEQHVKEYESELVAYKSEAADLHLKLQTQNGIFTSNAKHNSEEFRRALQLKIDKLENAFEQESKKFEICNVEKEALQDEIHRLAVDKIALENENSVILKNFNDAQEQCKALINVIEALKQENDHFKSRLNEFNKNAVGSPSETGHNEKLRKMLVDRSVELNALKAKLCDYEINLKELLEYRQLKMDVFKKDFQTCDNQNHTKELLLMQNELQNYRRTIEDKNQQISNLNANNKDLKEKIEEMLLQTRNEIQNISSKYNMPQLEIMRRELEQAEHNGKILSKKLEESEDRRLSLLQKLQSESDEKDTEALLEELEKCREDLKASELMLTNEQEQNRKITKQLEYQKTELLQLKNELEQIKIQRRKAQNDKSLIAIEDAEDYSSIKDDYEALKTQLRSVMEHLERNGSKPNRRNYPEIVRKIKDYMNEFLKSHENGTIEKGIIEENIYSWMKLLDQIEIQDPDEVLKKQYQEALMNLREREDAIRELKEHLQDLKNELTTSEGEKYSLHMEVKEITKKLQQLESQRSGLEAELENLRMIIKKVDTNLSEASDKENMENGATKIGKLQKDLKLLNEQLKKKEHECEISLQTIKRHEHERKDARKLLEKMKSEDEKLKGENETLRNELAKVQENCVKVNANDTLEKENDFKNRLAEELMRSELKLRDDLQIEYQKRIADIEERYQKSVKETTELCKKQKTELEDQDKKFRDYLKIILTECESCTTKLENEKLDLAGQLRMLRLEYENYKRTSVAQQEKYCAMLKTMERESKKNNEAWELWSKKVVCSCLDIEATNKKVRDRVLQSMERYDQEVAAIEKLSNARKEKKTKKTNSETP